MSELPRDGSGIVDPETGQPRLHAELCATCVYHAGNLMHLRPGRLKEMQEGAIANGSWIRCHERLAYGPHATLGEAVRRGFYDAVGERSQGVRIVLRRNGGPRNGVTTRSSWPTGNSRRSGNFLHLWEARSPRST